VILVFQNPVLEILSRFLPTGNERISELGPIGSCGILFAVEDEYWTIHTVDVIDRASFVVVVGSLSR